MESLLLASLREVLLEAPAATSVLEVGCGDGRFLSAMASALPGACLVGLDVSSRAIKKAAVRVCAEDRISLREAPVESIPLDADSFDLVVTNRSFHHWTDRLLGLREVSRVLRAGGSLVVADALATGAIGRPWVTRLAERLDGGQFADPQAFDAMLQQSGFAFLRRIPVQRSAGMLFVTVARLA